MNPETASPQEGVDVQAGKPATRVSLSRVGVTGVEKVLAIGESGHYHANLNCFVDLGPDQAGVHMSRFEEIVAEAMEEAASGRQLKAEQLAARPAELLQLLGPLLALYAGNYLLSTVVAKLLLPRGDAIALVYGTVMRNLSIALALAMNAFGSASSDAALVITLAYIIQVQSAAWYVKLTDTLFGQKPAA